MEDYYSVYDYTVDIDDDYFSDIFNSTNGSFPGDECCSGGGDVCDQEEGRSFEAVVIPVLYSLAFVVGLLGNVLLLGVLAQSRKAWSVTDTFILHLGVADVLLLLTLPWWSAQALQSQGWTFGTPLCMITGAVFTVNFYCGIFLLACISLDRYLSIVHATQMYSRKKPWVVHVSCLCVWFFSLMLSIPDWIFMSAEEDSRRGRTECIRNYIKFGKDAMERWRLASRVLYHVVGFLLPSVVLVFCYSSILRRLRCGSQNLQKQKAFKVIMAVVLVFFICWTPYNITLMVDTLYAKSMNETCSSNSSLEKAMVVTSSLGYLHCSLNPILYAFVGVKFRRQLLRMFGLLRCKLMATSRLSTISRRSSIWSESGDTSNSIAI